MIRGLPVFLTLLLTACGDDDGTTPQEVSPPIDTPTVEASERPEDVIGTWRISIGKESREVRGFCSNTVIRSDAGAVLMINFDEYITDAEAKRGWRGADLSASISAPPEQPMTATSFGFVDRGKDTAGRAPVTWIYDITAPQSTFDILVDGEPWDPMSGAAGPVGTSTLLDAQLTLNAAVVTTDLPNAQLTKNRATMAFKGPCETVMQTVKVSAPVAN